MKHKSKTYQLTRAEQSSAQVTIEAWPEITLDIVPRGNIFASLSLARRRTWSALYHALDLLPNEAEKLPACPVRFRWVAVWGAFGENAPRHVLRFPEAAISELRRRSLVEAGRIDEVRPDERPRIERLTDGQS